MKLKVMSIVDGKQQPLGKFPVYVDAEQTKVEEIVADSLWVEETTLNPRKGKLGLVISIGGFDSNDAYHRYWQLPELRILLERKVAKQSWTEFGLDTVDGMTWELAKQICQESPGLIREIKANWDIADPVLILEP